MKKQTIFRVSKNKDNPYVMINRTMLSDKRLSWKAKGILSYLLSMPDDWQVYSTEIQRHATDGIDSLSSGLKELIKLGYIKRTRRRNNKGHFEGYEYVIHEVSTESGLSKNGLSRNGLPKNGKSNTTNNDSTNTDNTNTDNTKEYSAPEDAPHTFIKDINEAQKEAYKIQKDILINENFESLWSEYPSKKGKGRISDSKKKELYKLGDEFKRCISRYKEEVERERLNGFRDLKYQNGRTFFNSGYVDYLDENYKELTKDEEGYGSDAGDGYEGLGLTAEDLQ